MLYTEKELGKQLKKSRATISTYRLKGWIRPFQVSGNGQRTRYLYDFNDVKRQLKLVDKWPLA